MTNPKIPRSPDCDDSQTRPVLSVATIFHRTVILRRAEERNLAAYPTHGRQHEPQAVLHQYSTDSTLPLPGPRRPSHPLRVAPLSASKAPTSDDVHARHAPRPSR